MPRAAKGGVLRDIARRDLGADGRPADRAHVDEVRADLGPALRAGQLHLVFQPIVELSGGGCERVEVLVRWRHPRLGLIDPRDIVRFARADGLLPALAVWTLQTASRERERWRRDGGELQLSLNLAGEELSDAGQQDLREAMQVTQTDPRSLTFEVPADRALTGGLWSGLRRVAATGARVALDDLATPDSISRSVASDIDELKLSRALVRRVVADHAAQTAARELIEEARDLGITAVAVGVEDRVTSEWLLRAGCRYAQGYAMSLPLAANEVPRWRQWAMRLTLGTTALSGAAAVPAAVFMPHAATAPASEIAGGTTCCTLHAAAATHDTGLAMRNVTASGVQVHIDASLDPDAVARITAAVGRDVIATQADLGTSFERAPDVYVLGTRASFAFALQRAFGQRATDAAALSVANGGVNFPGQSAIVINWQNVSGDHDLAVIRHEFTHALVHQIAGVSTDIPAWVDEGLATRAERTVASDPVQAARDSSTTLALLRSNSVSLRDLSSPGDWTLANARLDGRAYAVASDAVGVLEHSLGHDGLTALLAHAHRVGFAQAFGEATGGSVEDFANSFAAHDATLHGGAWITVHGGDGGAHWTAAGFEAGAPLHVTIEGGSYHVNFDVEADRDGTYQAIFGGTAPAGTYIVTVTSGTMSASGQVAI